MKIPGFSAEASTYRSTAHYCSGAAWGEVSGSYANPAQIMRLPALGGVEGGGGCHPVIGDCVPDKTCASGKSQHALTADRRWIKDCACSLFGDGGGVGDGGGATSCPQNPGLFGACCEGLAVACEATCAVGGGGIGLLFCSAACAAGFATCMASQVWPCNQL